MRRNTTYVIVATFLISCSNAKGIGYDEGAHDVTAPLVANELVLLVDARRAANCLSLSRILLNDAEVEMTAALKHDAEFGEKVWAVTANTFSVSSGDMQRMTAFVAGALEGADSKSAGDLLHSCLDDVDKASGLAMSKVEGL